MQLKGEKGLAKVWPGWAWWPDPMGPADSPKDFDFTLNGGSLQSCDERSDMT